MQAIGGSSLIGLASNGENSSPAEGLQKIGGKWKERKMLPVPPPRGIKEHVVVGSKPPTFSSTSALSAASPSIGKVVRGRGKKNIDRLSVAGVGHVQEVQSEPADVKFATPLSSIKKVPASKAATPKEQDPLLAGRSQKTDGQEGGKLRRALSLWRTQGESEQKRPSLASISAPSSETPTPNGKAIPGREDANINSIHDERDGHTQKVQSESANANVLDEINPPRNQPDVTPLQEHVIRQNNNRHSSNFTLTEGEAEWRTEGGKTKKELLNAVKELLQSHSVSRNLTIPPPITYITEYSRTNFPVKKLDNRDRGQSFGRTLVIQKVSPPSVQSPFSASGPAKKIQHAVRKSSINYTTSKTCSEEDFPLSPQRVNSPSFLAPLNTKKLLSDSHLKGSEVEPDSHINQLPHLEQSRSSENDQKLSSSNKINKDISPNELSVEASLKGNEENVPSILQSVNSSPFLAPLKTEEHFSDSHLNGSEAEPDGHSDQLPHLGQSRSSENDQKLSSSSKTNKNIIPNELQDTGALLKYNDENVLPPISQRTNSSPFLAPLKAEVHVPDSHSKEIKAESDSHVDQLPNLDSSLPSKDQKSIKNAPAPKKQKWYRRLGLGFKKYFCCCLPWFGSSPSSKK
ncbi:MAG: hypothetical protein C5B47_08440 [Verrucomicrobia bacterium]|nr:MAG: hypothetical protein C5B47_08440 [Verrucomicrobiota bacterium]